MAILPKSLKKNGETSVLKIVDVIIGLKITTEEEVQGLDITQHSEIGILYSLS